MGQQNVYVEIMIMGGGGGRKGGVQGVIGERGVISISPEIRLR